MIKKNIVFRDDLDYYGIRDIENLFGQVSKEDYYKKAEEINKKDYQ